MSAHPRLALVLLRLAIRNADVREGVLGDLEEDLCVLEKAGNRPRFPHLWYWRAILCLSARFTVKAVRAGRSRGTAGGRRGRSVPARPSGVTPSLLNTFFHDLVHSFRLLRRDGGTCFHLQR